MRFQDITADGKIVIQRVQIKPAWEPSDIGRLIYVIDEKIMYYGTSEGWARCTGFGLRPVLVTKNYTAEESDLCLVDTRNGPITITLPPSPKMGAQIGIVDVAGTFESNYCTIQANGKHIQRSNKNLVLDINDFSGDLTYDPLTTSWKVNIDGVVQLLGNATLWVHKSIITAQNIDGAGGQKQFTFDWEYNPYHDNIAVYVQGVKQFEFEKTNQNSITLPEPVPAGTKVGIYSIPLEGSFSIEEFVTFSKLADDYVKKDMMMDFIKANDGDGSGLDADLLDGIDSSKFLLKENLLNEIKLIDGTGSEIDADTVDGYHASVAPGPWLIPVANLDGKLDASYLPYAQSTYDIVTSFMTPAGAKYLEITGLQSLNGHKISIRNLYPTEMDTSDLLCQVYDEETSSWIPFPYWTLEYCDHQSGGKRDFNTNTNMVIARNVAQNEAGVNIDVTLLGFRNDSNIQTSRQVVCDVYGLAVNSERFASHFKSIGAFRRDENLKLTGIRFWFITGNICQNSHVVVSKIV